MKSQKFDTLVMSKSDENLKKVLGSQNDCLKQHFYEIFVKYRFFDSYRQKLEESGLWDEYQKEIRKQIKYYKE